MNDLLLLVLSVVGLLALYWVLFGQWKHNKMMREMELARIKNAIKEQEKKRIIKKSKKK
jgi:hypothetical protein